MGLQDAYNTLLSSEVDDFEAFCDAYLVLKNVTATADDVAEMKEKRVIVLPYAAQGVDPDASFLNKILVILKSRICLLILMNKSIRLAIVLIYR